MDNNNDDLDKLIPQMNVNVPNQQLPQESSESIVPGEAVLGMFSEILNNIREDRAEIKDLVNNFVDMVINQGDATTSSKEALVNLVKIQAETSNSMAKIADLMTRINLKEKDTFPRYLAAHQNNTINIGSEKRDLIKQIQKFQKKKKEEDAK